MIITYQDVMREPKLLRRVTHLNETGWEDHKKWTGLLVPVMHSEGEGGSDHVPNSGRHKERHAK